jgi:hypothetical protein
MSNSKEVGEKLNIFLTTVDSQFSSRLQAGGTLFSLAYDCIIYSLIFYVFFLFLPFTTVTQTWEITRQPKEQGLKLF